MSSTRKTRATQRRGVGYLRVSRVGGREGESFISVDEQRKKITALAKSQGVKLVDWQTDLDQSGGKYERPGFQAALAAVENGDADVVVVAYLNRFARSTGDLSTAVERLTAAGGGLLAADPITDTTNANPYAVFTRNIFASLAQLELEVARENWRTAQSNAIERGISITNAAPLGLRFDATHRLEPDPETCDVIPELYRRRASGASKRQLVEFVFERTGKRMYPQTIDRMIANRTYVGEVRFGDLVSFRSEQQLVTEDEWQAAQLKHAPQQQRSNSRSLLAGVLVCASCGSKMTAAGARAKPRYSCQNESNGRCTRPVSVKRAIADDAVERAVLSWASSEKLDKATAAGIAARERELRSADAAVTSAQREVDSWVELTSVADLGRDLYLRGLDTRQQRLDDATAELERLQANGSTHDLRKTLRDEYVELTVDDRRHLLRSVVDSVTVHRSAAPNRSVRPDFARRAQLTLVDGSVLPLVDETPDVVRVSAA